MSREARAAVDIPLQWQVTAAQPELNVRLLLERDHQKIALDQPLGVAWYPSAAWQPGRILQLIHVSRCRVSSQRARIRPASASPIQVHP